ncbi:hypothetical protein EYF80_028409 [Liparis tanakae]|uniref:Uncharacterized protein n=1 Tax=Liparis tanakae TaxID=230148 RepID=A0A4Z2H9E3_9TELE|nr:hypothetical protein EYF80_028409 [Liparis tanakae]
MEGERTGEGGRKRGSKSGREEGMEVERKGGMEVERKGGMEEQPYASTLRPIQPLGFQSRGTKRRKRVLSGAAILFWTTASEFTFPTSL